MPEKAALELSGFSTREQFREEVLSSALNFLALASIRILMRKTKRRERQKLYMTLLQSMPFLQS